MGNSFIKPLSYIKFKDYNNYNKLGRWILKNHKQSEISQYWSNIDHCGDKVCGNLIKNKSFYEKEILKIKK